MRRDELLAILREQPFKPFRLVLSNGQKFEIRHPDMALVAQGTVHVSMPPPHAPDAPARQVVYVSLLHIVTVEYLNMPAAAGHEQGE